MKAFQVWILLQVSILAAMTATAGEPGLLPYVPKDSSSVMSLDLKQLDSLQSFIEKCLPPSQTPGRNSFAEMRQDLENAGFPASDYKELCLCFGRDIAVDDDSGTTLTIARTSISEKELLAKLEEGRRQGRALETCMVKGRTAHKLAIKKESMLFMFIEADVAVFAGGEAELASYLDAQKGWTPHHAKSADQSLDGNCAFSMDAKIKEMNFVRRKTDTAAWPNVKNLEEALRNIEYMRLSIAQDGKDTILCGVRLEMIDELSAQRLSLASAAIPALVASIQNDQSFASFMQSSSEGRNVNLTYKVNSSQLKKLLARSLPFNCPATAPSVDAATRENVKAPVKTGKTSGLTIRVEP